jgi:hypothetical protein
MFSDPSNVLVNVPNIVYMALLMHDDDAFVTNVGFHDYVTVTYYMI